MIDAIAPCADEQKNRRGRIRRIGRVAILVTDHTERAEPVRGRADLGGKVAAARPVEPSHAHDVESIQNRGGQLSCGLAAGVDAAGRGLFILAVEATRLAGEHLVRADLHQFRAAARASFRQIFGAERVDRERVARRVLGPRLRRSRRRH